MKFLKFIFNGILFGILLTKGEVISWYRIYEMFHFGSFHMYGVIGSAVVLGAIGTNIIKKKKDMHGNPISIVPKDHSVWKKYIFGGAIFGMGWAMTGACPGPIFMIIGSGFTVFIVVLLSATLGTFVYGVLKDKLPH